MIPSGDELQQDPVSDCHKTPRVSGRQREARSIEYGHMAERAGFGWREAPDGVAFLKRMDERGGEAGLCNSSSGQPPPAPSEDE